MKNISTYFLLLVCLACSEASLDSNTAIVTEGSPKSPLSGLWYLSKIGDRVVDRGATLLFEVDSNQQKRAILENACCNRADFSYEIQASTVQVTKLGQTKALCLCANDLEDVYFDEFSKVVSYQAEENKLTLSTSESVTLEFIK